MIKLNKRLFNNKLGKEIGSLITIILLLCSIIAGNLIYRNYQNKITANAIKESKIKNENLEKFAFEANFPASNIVEDIDELSQLNEGWYYIKNGYVYYVEHFDSYVFLNLKVRNPRYDNGLLVVNADGTTEFDESFDGPPEYSTYSNANSNTDNNKEQELSKNQISGEVTGLESISGFATSDCPATLIDKESDKWLREGDSCTYMYSDDKGTITANYEDIPNRLFYISGTGLYEVYDAHKYFDVKTRVESEPSGTTQTRAGSGGDIVTTTAKPAKKFEVKFKDAQGNDISVIVQANNEKEALETARSRMGITSDKASEVVPTPSTNEYVVITNKESYVIQASGDKDAETKGKNLAKARAETYTKAERAFTFDDFKRNNPTIPENILTGIYNAQYGSGVLQGDTIQITKPVEIKGNKGESLGWWFDGKQYKEKKEADVAAANKLQQQVVQKALSDLGGTQLGVDEHGIPIAKKGNEVYKFDIINLKFDKVTGTYRTKETAGTGDNAVDILRTFDNTGSQTRVEASRGIQTFEINDEIAKQISSSKGEGVIVSDVMRDGNKVGKQIDLEKLGLRYTLAGSGAAGYTATTGTITTEQFRPVFLDKDNNEFSANEVEKLKKEGRGKDITEAKFHSFIQDIEKENGVTTYITSYSLSFKDGTETYEGVKFNAQTGERDGFVYGERYKDQTEKKLTLTNDGTIADHNGNFELADKARTAFTQYKSRMFFANVERALTEFKGIEYFPSLFVDWVAGGKLEKWRDGVNKIFANNYLSAEHRKSQICSKYYKTEQRGTTYGECRQGINCIVSHIEAVRTEPIKNDKGQNEYIYKITFNIRNGQNDKDGNAPEKMNVDVIIRNKEKSVKLYYPKLVEIKRGESSGRNGKDPLVMPQASQPPTTALYDEICLAFDRIPLTWRLNKDNDGYYIFCNKIQEADGTPTNLENRPAGEAKGFNREPNQI